MLGRPFVGQRLVQQLGHQDPQGPSFELLAPLERRQHQRVEVDRRPHAPGAIRPRS
jgi:hypothetical protein